MGILRLAHVDVRTPDLELSTAYYTEVLGLQLPVSWYQSGPLEFALSERIAAA